VAELPSGTVTFLFTDIEGSTRLWEEHPDAMKDSLARHDAILRASVEDHEGVVFATMGDGVAAAFASAPSAVRAVLDAQRRLGEEPWGPTGPLRVRMGLHTDEGRLRAPGEYVNRPLNRCARLMAVGHGGQVLLSDATATVVGDGLPAGVGLVDLGEHRLRDLGAPMRVFQLTHADLTSEFPALESLDALPGNLPRQTTSFVGRDDDVATLADSLRDRSLVTLTGVGGVGKTRLAIQVAADLVPDFPDGAWLCELAPVSDPDALWDTLAASLGVHPSPGRGLDESVLEYLAPKKLLLVLDNCEHLLDGAARAAARIGQTCPRVVVLATSREGLAVRGEQIVAVPSLGLPAADAALDDLSGVEAVRLFVDRAHDAKRDFALTERNAAAVAQLCRRLDGIPLAIELAAARVRSLTPEDLVARLDQRFRLLTRGSRAALERHQTLRNTIDWSYDLLGDTERDALNRLSVFAGGADLPAAEAVVSGGSLDEIDVADALSLLVDKSLVVVDEDDAGVRYRLLESIRQYAQERLEAAGDAAAVRRRHAEHFVARAEASGPRLRSREQVEAASEVERDTDNFRAALDWAVEVADPDRALRLVAPLAVNALVIGYTAMDWAETAIAVPGATDESLYPVVASWAVWSATMRGDLDGAAAVAATLAAVEEALGSRDPAACQGPGTLAFFRADLDGALAHAQEWVDRAREAGDAYELAHALTLAAAACQFADPDRTLSMVEEAVGICRDTGIVSAMGSGLIMLAGQVPLDEAPRAFALAAEAGEVGRRIGDRQTVAAAGGMVALLAARLGQWRDALVASVATAEEQLHLGALNLLSGPLWAAAIALVGLGDLERGAVVIAASDSWGERWWDADWGEGITRATDAALLDGLGDARLATLRAQGSALDAAGAVAYLRDAVDCALGDE
jgi:predicted ATPase/class 3 adenylate cyclase